MRKLIIFPLVFTLFFSGTLYGAGSADEHFKKAMSLYDSGLWSAAEKEFVKARKEITAPQDLLALRSDCMIAICASRAGEDYARALLEDFLARYPHTIYHNDVRFALSGEKYKAGEWEEALNEYLSVDPFDLTDSQINEYQFKSGHCYFQVADYEAAQRALRQVDKNSEYGSSAIYYISYIDYTNGNYGAAKQGFTSLMNDDSYNRIAPYYLLQIEFLQNNYDYVTRHGDALVLSATKSRATEISRLIAESWYHLNNHDKALSYLNSYRTLGGIMGREESYIEGYCLYMKGDYKQAAKSLAEACTTDDALSQNAGYHLADCYLKSGEKRLAMQSFSIASAGDFDKSIREDALFNYGKLQYELGGGVFNEAINILNRYVKEYPTSPRVNQAREYLLSAYYNSRNYEAAYDAIMLIPNPDNNIKAALQKITYFRAMEFFNSSDYAEASRLLTISSRNRYNAKYTALASFWQAEINYRRGDYNAAVPLYREYVTLSPESEPEHAMAYYGLGYSYFNIKNWTEASSWFGKFLAGKTTGEYSADTYNRLGDIKYSERSYWQAIEDYDKAVKYNTAQQYYSQYRRAVLLGLVDRVARKIESLEQIISTDKGEYVDDAVYELGQTYMNQERFADAAKMLTRYVETYPSGNNHMDALSDMGLVYLNMGKSDDALKYYKRIVSSYPNSSQAKDAMLGIRSIYVDKNDVDGYFSYAKEAGVETDMSVVQRDSLTFASAERQYLVASDPKTAVTALQGYLKNYPKGSYRAVAFYYLGDCALRAGDRKTSVGAYSQLSSMSYNEYTVRAMEHLSQMQEQDRNYAEALDTYRKLSRTASVPTVINRALEGYMRMALQVPGEDMSLVANEILESPFAASAVVRQANFVKAKAFAAENREQEAMAIYEKLGVESQTPEGAESSYRVIEQRFKTKDLADAKKRIFALSAQNSPHTYWVGKSFLMLGDIHSLEGDSFQARATFQSIVDGYSIENDGVLDAARERIKNLK